MDISKIVERHCLKASKANPEIHFHVEQLAPEGYATRTSVKLTKPSTGNEYVMLVLYEGPSQIWVSSTDTLGLGFSSQWYLEEEDKSVDDFIGRWISVAYFTLSKWG